MTHFEGVITQLGALHANGETNESQINKPKKNVKWIYIYTIYLSSRICSVGMSVRAI